MLNTVKIHKALQYVCAGYVEIFTETYIDIFVQNTFTNSHSLTFLFFVGTKI